MNVERVYMVAALIEASADAAVTINEMTVKFDMGEFGASMDEYDERDERSCGTIACVAGYTGALFQPEAYREYAFGTDYHIDMEHVGKTELELTEDEARDLFVPTGFNRNGHHYNISYEWMNNNPRKVAQALRWMADNNTVSWADAFIALGETMDGPDYRAETHDTYASTDSYFAHRD
jgi:hypothetical protein